VTFTAPTVTGGSSLTYTVTSSPGGLTGTGPSPVTVNGLDNDTAYTFIVTATNESGLSTNSKASNRITTWAVPGKPTITSLNAGDSQVTVGFKAPSNGGSAITGYTVTALTAANSPAGTDMQANSTLLSHTVDRLTNWTPYTFTVTATNAVGTGLPSSHSHSVTPEPSSPFAGTWEGSWESNNKSESYGSGTLTATITQSGSTLTGTLDVSGSSCGDVQTNLSGTVSGNTAKFNASVTCDGAVNKLQYTTGQISGTELSGTWTLYSNGAYHDRGTFSMSKD
jgi:hypothetical protein